MKATYLVKIVPPVGYRVFRLEFSRRHIVFATLLTICAVLGLGGYYARTLHHAEARVGELRSLTADQQSRLRQIDAATAALGSKLSALRLQNEQIRRLIGERGSPDARATSRADKRQSSTRSVLDFRNVAERIEALRSDSHAVEVEGTHLRTLALRVLNMRRLEDIARARVLAAIPSINPAGTAAIASGYGWRVFPWPEFHRGVDLDANYGDDVRASAAGTIVAAGYDGGYGVKVDIDHGNGYHTWYCHLSRADVTPGQYVKKAEHIAVVGSTGASTGPHLHYQIMLDGVAVDPEPYLTGIPDRVLASLK